VIAASIVGLLLVGIGVMNMGGGDSTAADSPQPPSAIADPAPATGGTPTLPPVETVANPTPQTGGNGRAQPATGAAGSPEPEPVDPEPAAAVAAADPPARGSAPPPATNTQPVTGAAATPQSINPTPPPAAAPPPTPGEVRIALPSTAMAVGGTQDASVQVFTTAGARMTSGFNLGWRSTDTGVLAVDTRGGVRASGPGTAWVVASAGSARDSVLVSVAAVVAAVEIAESDVSLEVGGSRALSAAAMDSNGTRLQRDIRWTSSDPAVVSVDASSGRVTAGSAGRAQVTASADGVSDAVTVSVAAPGPALPPAEAAQGAIASYVATLAGGDEDAVRRLWGSGDQDGLEEVLDLMGERGFSATLRTVGDPAEQGGAAVVPFSVQAAYRNFAGAERRSTLNFVARFERSGSAWNLVTAVVQ